MSYVRTEPRLLCHCFAGTWGPHSQSLEWGQWSASLRPGGCRGTSLPSLILPSSGGDGYCPAVSGPLALQPREAGCGPGAGARRGQWAGGFPFWLVLPKASGALLTGRACSCNDQVKGTNSFEGEEGQEPPLSPRPLLFTPSPSVSSSREPARVQMCCTEGRVGTSRPRPCFPPQSCREGQPKPR